MILQFFIHIQDCCNRGIKAGEQLIFHYQKVNISFRINKLSCYGVFICIVVIFEKRINLFVKELSNNFFSLRRITLVIAFSAGIRCNHNRRGNAAKIPQLVKKLHCFSTGRTGQHRFKSFRFHKTNKVLMQVKSDHIQTSFCLSQCHKTAVFDF